MQCSCSRGHCLDLGGARQCGTGTGTLTRDTLSAVLQSRVASVVRTAGQGVRVAATGITERPAVDYPVAEEVVPRLAELPTGTPLGLLIREWALAFPPVDEAVVTAAKNARTVCRRRAQVTADAASRSEVYAEAWRARQRLM